MLRHIVTWNYKDGFSEAENKENALKIKHGLESLAYFDGVIEIKVYINELGSSNKDIVLNSLFESEEALTAYQIHPEHKKMSALIGSVMQNRACIDYYE
ncbi:MAG: Dabb family protein [Oscillospiraceae bacterium]|nr:Dabb family protein [Oscillospiraceae bacterium]